MDFTTILLGIFFLPFVLAIGLIVLQVTFQVLTTIYADMLGIMGFDNLRSSIIRKFL